MQYRRCGQSGLKLPPFLSALHNFGDATLIENSRQLLQRAFDLGITHLISPITMAHLLAQQNVTSDVFSRRIFNPGAMS
jgi:hypothetical protein